MFFFRKILFFKSNFSILIFEKFDPKNDTFFQKFLAKVRY